MLKTATPYSDCIDGLEIKGLIEIEQCGKRVLRKFGIELKDDHKFSTSDKVSIGILAVSMAVTIALVLYVLFAPPRPDENENQPADDNYDRDEPVPAAQNENPANDQNPQENDNQNHQQNHEVDVEPEKSQANRRPGQN